MRLDKFNAKDGSFEAIVNDDGSLAITFHQLGTSGSYFQMVVGAEGSVNIDAKTPAAEEDIDFGLWPQHKGGLYIQSETRPNWVKISPSDAGQDIQLQTGGEPYIHQVGLDLKFQGGPQMKVIRPETGEESPLARLEREMADLKETRAQVVALQKEVEMLKAQRGRWAALRVLLGR